MSGKDGKSGSGEDSVLGGDSITGGDDRFEIIKHTLLDGIESKDKFLNKIPFVNNLKELKKNRPIKPFERDSSGNTVSDDTPNPKRSR